jgi:hypothetical protein
MKQKEQRFKLESDIITKIFEDNKNTVHFDYHVDIDDTSDGIRLDLYTRSANHSSILLLHQTSGTSSVHALERMLSFLNQDFRGEEFNSYTLNWKAVGEDREHTSHYFETSEEEVMRKFFYNKTKSDYSVRIVLNPLS